jgi:iron complex outermembrane recepter protein
MKMPRLLTAARLLPHAERSGALLERRCELLVTAASLSLVTAMLLAGTAHAQAAAPEGRAQAQSAAEQNDAGEITVTGSRIVRDGYSAPTPVSVLSGADIAAQKPANLADLVITLPSAAAGLTTVNSAGNISNPGAGVSSISLRNLGSQRTLVLLNGQRSVASTASGNVDINTFPQDLVERVELVTGGASAQYGSDAVAGVVNFILNEKYKGFKVSADTGITNYGDGNSYRFSATLGHSFLDDRLHVLVNGEYFHSDEVLTSQRPWNSHGYVLMNNPAYVVTNGVGNGQPALYVGSGIGPSNKTPGGLINSLTRNGFSVTSDPLIGTYFLAPGSTAHLNYGQVSGSYMLGGDWQKTFEGLAGNLSLQPSQTRSGVFTRVAYDISDDVTVYGQFSWNRSHTLSHYGPPPQTGVSISADNAYLLTQYPQIAAALAAGGYSGFSMGTSNTGFGQTGTDVTRNVYRYVAGLKGNFDLLNHDWSWDVYYQHGLAKTFTVATNIPNTTRLALAQDAIVSNGQIICRSTLANPGNGCVPIDRLGTDGPSGAALAYIYGPAQPRRTDSIKQDVASATINGQLFDLSGGPLAIAFGGEWRKEQMNNVADVANSRWLYANYLSSKGQYTVKEAFVEVDVPLFEGFDLNGAVRYTDYSTSGSVVTWKVGATYTPIPDVKFRGTISRDIRAPNLQELYAPPTGQNSFVTLPSNAPAPGSQGYFQQNRGNPNLKPEIANTWTAGLVLTPSFLPGFTASVDYYQIKMDNNIGSLSAQQIVDFCYAGLAPNVCGGISFTGNVLQTIAVAPYNFGSRKQTGLDVEASYVRRVGSGTFSIHGQATYYLKNIVDNLVFPVDTAGANATSVLNDGTPKLHYRVSATYDQDPFSINLVAHGVGSSVYANDWIECTASCPTSSTQFRTINNNHVRGAVYFDGAVTLKVPSAGHEFKLSFIVKNILNKNPVRTGWIGPSGGYEPYPQTNVDLYDTLGRVFRVAATVQF